MNESPQSPAGGRTITIKIADDEVLVALKRPEGYEDVHPELVAEDAIKETWPEYRTIDVSDLGALAREGEP